MSTNNNDGGPAFPVPPGATTFTGDPRDGAGYEPSQAGMTLRDYFAAKFAAVMFTAATEAEPGLTFGSVSRSAYRFADEMLAARTQP